MKIVINKCFGGFSLSARAVKRLAELNGKKCYFFRTEIVGGEFSKPFPTTLEKIEAGNRWDMWSAYSVPTPPPDTDMEEWHKLPLEERQARNRRDAELSLDKRPEKRDDPNLVRVVEELGKAAAGAHAELAIIEIPDGTDWTVEEYDGMESVHETHRSWS